MRRKKKGTHPKSNFGYFQSLIKTSILDILTHVFFSIRSCVPTEVIKVLNINMYGWEQCKKKDDENDQLSCGIYSSPAAAGLLCKVGSATARLGTCLHRKQVSIETCLFLTGPHILHFFADFLVNNK